MFASVFFVDSITAADLKELYARAGRGTGRIRVLIVPGHDDESSGTAFRGVREADMTSEVGEELYRTLLADPIYEPILVRTKEGYTAPFVEYFASEKEETTAFLKEKKEIMRQHVREGTVHLLDGVFHNSAPSAVALRLYGINKWANEHDIHIVIHIHFNDYPGRPSHRPGRYNGFAL